MSPGLWCFVWGGPLQLVHLGSRTWAHAPGLGSGGRGRWWGQAGGRRPCQVHHTIHPRSASPLHKELCHPGKTSCEIGHLEASSPGRPGQTSNGCVSGVLGRSPARGGGVVLEEVSIQDVRPLAAFPPDGACRDPVGVWDPRSASDLCCGLSTAPCGWSAVAVVGTPVSSLA